MNRTFLYIDQDRTVCKTLEMLHAQFGNENHLTFANGGDQNNTNIPELPIFLFLGIELIDGEDSISFLVISCVIWIRMILTNIG